MQFKPSIENNNCINFLDLNIIRTPHNLNLGIYRKKVPRVKPTRQVVLSPTLVVLNKTGLQQLTNSKTQYGAVQCRSEVGSIVLRVFSHRPSCFSSSTTISTNININITSPTSRGPPTMEEVRITP